MAEIFHLKWDDFQSNASNSFGSLRNEDYLHDVTLVGDDNHEIFAHKLVLSACSEYFRNIFKNRKAKTETLLLCLNGTTNKDLENILDYMYFGEVEIQQEELDRFLDISQRLKIDGLKGTSTPDSKAESTDVFQTRNDEHFQDNSRALPDKDKSIIKEINQGKNAERKISLPNIDYDNIDQPIENNIEKYNSVWRCKNCGKEDQKKSNIRRHFERNHLEGYSFRCSQCDSAFRSRASLSDHEHKHHQYK